MPDITEYINALRGPKAQDRVAPELLPRNPEAALMLGRLASVPTDFSNFPGGGQIEDVRPYTSPLNPFTNQGTIGPFGSLISPQVAQRQRDELNRMYSGIRLRQAKPILGD